MAHVLLQAGFVKSKRVNRQGETLPLLLEDLVHTTGKVTSHRCFPGSGIVVYLGSRFCASILSICLCFYSMMTPYSKLCSSPLYVRYFLIQHHFSGLLHIFHILEAYLLEHFETSFGIWIRFLHRTLWMVVLQWIIWAISKISIVHRNITRRHWRKKLN